MNFLNRLKYYLIGVGLGILMVMAIFKDRKLTSWTPQNQVIEEIHEKPLEISADINCRFKCGGINTENAIDSIFSTGDVDFKNSNVKNHDEREYIIHFEDHAINEIKVVIYAKKVEVTSVLISDVTCDCPTLTSE